MADAGQVTIRFSVRDHEVVRQALQNIGKDGDKALKALDAAAKPVPKTLAAVLVASREAQDQVQGWAAQLGPLGRVLSALGPGGLAAAAGVGAIGFALHKATEMAQQFSTDMLKIRDTAQTIGITTTQFQAIADAGSEFAVSEEKMTAGLQRFTSQLDEFRRGEGKLLEIITRIDPALARQMASTRDTARALDLLSQAYEKAGSSSAALSRAAFGRTGFDIGLVIDSVRKQGGIDELTRAFVASGDAIDENLIKRIAKLRAEIDDMAGDARRNFASIFSEPILQTQHRWAEQWREFSRIAKEFALAPDLARLMRLMESGVNTGEFQTVVWALSALSGAPGLAGKGVREAASWMQGGTAPAGEMQGPPTRDQWMQQQRAVGEAALRAGRGTPLVTDPNKIYGQDKASAEFDLNKARQLAAALGAAITPSEQLKIKQLELAAAMEKGGLSQSIVSRALREFTLAQQEAAVAARQKLGVASEEEISAVKLARLEQDRAKGVKLTAEEYRIAQQIIRREANDTAEQLAVRQATFRGLKQFELQAGDLNKQLDRTALDITNGMTTALVDTATGAKSAKDAIRDFGLQTAGSVAQMIIQMQIAVPIARALQAALGGVPGAVPGAAAAGASGATAVVGSALGNVVSSRGVMPLQRFGRGGIARGPMMSIFGEGRSPEAYVPLPDGRSIPVTMDGAGGAKVVNNFSVINQSSAVSVSQEQRGNASGGVDMVTFIKDVFRDGMARGEFDGASLSRFGMRPLVNRR